MKKTKQNESIIFCFINDDMSNPLVLATKKIIALNLFY